MTNKQADELQLQIKQIKAALAADKKRWGGVHDDSGGLRYLPLQYYIKLGDWNGGIKYLKWFDKNFPDDVGFADFLFEWTIILFKSGDIKQAKQKAFSVFCANTYVFDKFFGKPIVPIDKYEGSNIAVPTFTNYFHYSCAQPDLADFADWLNQFTSTENFIATSEEFIAIYKQLKTEKDREARRTLLEQARQLQERFYHSQE